MIRPPKLFSPTMVFILAVILTVLIVCSAVVPAAWADPITFFDNFDDGNADGWWLGYSLAAPLNQGNWRIENRTLVQDRPGDGYIALVDNLQASNQSISMSLSLNGPAGYGGAIFWY
jgi:hypothetical protein